MEKKSYQMANKYLIITLIGFLILLMGRGIGTKLDVYPTYVHNGEIGPAFQYYTLNTFYGATVDWGTEAIGFTGYRIPIYAVAGYIMIMLGFDKLKERSRVFTIGKWMAVMALGMNVLLNVLPFLFNGSQLCYIAICIGIACLGLELSVGYFLVCGVCDVLSGISFKMDRTTLGITWFASFVVRIVVFVTTWVQLANLTIVYNIILLWLWIFLTYTLLKLKTYITGEITFEK